MVLFQCMQHRRFHTASDQLALTLAIPSTTSAPTTMGSFLLKTQVGRILSMQGKTASSFASCCSRSLTCRAETSQPEGHWPFLGSLMRQKLPHLGMWFMLKCLHVKPRARLPEQGSALQGSCSAMTFLNLLMGSHECIAWWSGIRYPGRKR